MQLTLSRYPSGETECQGILEVRGNVFATMEQEVRFTPVYPSGVPSNSCIPFGRYEIEPFVRPSGKHAWLIVNEALGVYRYKHDRPDDKSRYLCLIHAGTYSYHSAGCILLGNRHTQFHSAVKDRTLPAVSNTTGSMDKLEELLGFEESHTLDIIPVDRYHV